MTEKAAWRPKRFDVAGVHPDEAWRAVAEMREVSREMYCDCLERGGLEPEGVFGQWYDTKPLRYGNGPASDVQRYLERGVEMMDVMASVNDAWSVRQREVRDRCNGLARSMKKVLDSRPDEFVPGDPWRRVKIQTSPAVVKEPGQKPLSERETREAVRNYLRRHFTRGPWEAMRAKAAYLAWEENAERRGVDAPLTEAAKPWKRFSDDLDRGKWLSASRKEIWAHVDVNEGIDFSQVQKAQQGFRRRRGMRM